MTTSERAEIRRDCSGLPPEDLAFISFMASSRFLTSFFLFPSLSCKKNLPLLY